MTDAPGVLAAIVAVNKAIAEQGIAKADKNTQQNFAFRGVDRVYEAMAGPMAEHGLFSTSDVLSVERAPITFSKSGGTGTAVYVTVRYTFWCATDGSSVSTTVAAEAMDSGDKATAKAMSVAHRTALLQLSTAPVNPAEPDADTYEVVPPEPLADPAEVDVLVAAMNTIEDETVRAEWKANFVSRFGLPSRLSESQLAVAAAFVASRPFEHVPLPPQNTNLPLDTAPVP